MNGTKQSGETISKEEAHEKLVELKSRGDVLVAEGDFSGDEIRAFDDRESTMYQVRSALVGEPRFYRRGTLVELIAENTQELYGKSEKT